MMPVMGSELFSDALSVSVPVDISRYRRLTSLGYAIGLALLLIGASTGVNLRVLLLLTLAPLVFVWITIARRLTALGKNPAWMLVAWPLATIIWMLLLFIPAPVDGEATAAVPPGMPTSLSARSLLPWVGITVAIYIVAIVVLALFISS